MCRTTEAAFGIRQPGSSTVSTPNAFSRTFDSRDLFRGAAALALAYAAVAAVSLAMLLVHAGLLVSLMAERGRLAVSLTPDEAREFQRLTGINLPDPESLPAPAALPADPTAPPLPPGPEGELPPDQPPPRTLYTFDDQGILPSLWCVHDKGWES